MTRILSVFLSIAIPTIGQIAKPVEPPDTAPGRLVKAYVKAFNSGGWTGRDQELRSRLPTDRRRTPRRALTHRGSGLSFLIFRETVNATGRFEMSTNSS